MGRAKTVLSKSGLLGVDLLMLLVTLGTQDKPFTRLLIAVEKQIQAGNIQEEVIVQAGSTAYESDKMKIIDYIPVEEFNGFIEKADIVITHGGVGSIITGLKEGKKVIAAARLKEFGEHTNDHQLQIIENFTSQGYILALEDFDKLGEVLEKAKSFIPKDFKSNTSYFIEQLHKEIES